MKRHAIYNIINITLRLCVRKLSRCIRARLKYGSYDFRGERSRLSKRSGICEKEREKKNRRPKSRNRGDSECHRLDNRAAY